MADRKPWRVYGARAIEGDYRGQPAAYEAVNSIVAAGIKARVFHWEDSRWCLYEEIEPDEEVAAARAERRRCTLCGDVLKRDEALNLSAWISADVPLPGTLWRAVIGWSPSARSWAPSVVTTTVRPWGCWAAGAPPSARKRVAATLESSMGLQKAAAT